MKNKGISDPFEQARSNLHTLTGILCIELGISTATGLGFTYGYAVVLPDTRIEGTLPNNADKAIVAEGADLHRIGHKVEDALSH